MSSIAIEDYYLEILCSHLDKGYQFALSVLGDPEVAYKVLYAVYDGFAKDFPVPSQEEDYLLRVLTEIWNRSQAVISQQDKSGDGDTEADSQGFISDWSRESESTRGSFILSEMSMRERAVLVLCDHFSLEISSVLTVLGLKESEAYIDLSRARQRMISHVG